MEVTTKADNTNKKKIVKKIIALITALTIMALPVIIVNCIRSASRVYDKKQSVIIEDCVVMAVVETPKETLLAVSLPQTWDNYAPDLNLRVVLAYEKGEKEKHDVAKGDVVTCGFPKNMKGYVIWE